MVLGRARIRLVKGRFGFDDMKRLEFGHITKAIYNAKETSNLLTFSWNKHKMHVSLCDLMGQITRKLTHKITD